jgi:hypothetical protein
MEGENPVKGRFDETWAPPGGDDTTELQTVPTAPGDREQEQGPCLYLGPGGQRCDRRALTGGYCASHRPGAPKLPKVASSKGKLFAVIAAALSALWPFLADLVREVVRWIHSH